VKKAISGDGMEHHLVVRKFMKQKTNILLSAFLAFSFILSACASLIAQEDEPITGEYGPKYSPQEHQTRTFDGLWKVFSENYIYYETANVNWDVIRDEYLARINEGLANEEFIALMRELESDLPIGSLTYQSRAERIEADTTDFSIYEGIGAFVGFQAEDEPHMVILDVIEGSPAEAAGIKPHDSIFAIDGSPVLLEEGIDAVNRVRGPSGTTVTLSIKTPGRDERSVEVTRAQLISTGKLEAYQIDDTNFGYVLFPPITYDGLLEDLLIAMQGFTSNKTLEGLILDLRVAGSARGWPLEELLTLFHNGGVGEFYNSAQQEQAVSVEGQDLYSSQSVPLIILVGSHTSGFPEILAASLQANERATIVGETTPGSVETTSSFYLLDGSRIFVETASFRLPNGDEVGTSGVQPDVPVALGWDEVVPTDDPVFLTALQLLGLDK
jgi:carboxyl-terminal processing protease